MPVVIDTNVLVSFAILPESVAARAVEQVLRSGEVIVQSEATFGELSSVLLKSKFDRYVSLQDRRRFLSLLSRVAVLVEPSELIRACRDPDDDKFLEVAVAADARLLMTGDPDLLALHPFRNIAIMTPGDYLRASAAP